MLAMASAFSHRSLRGSEEPIGVQEVQRPALLGDEKNGDGDAYRVNVLDGNADSGVWGVKGDSGMRW